MIMNNVLNRKLLENAEGSIQEVHTLLVHVLSEPIIVLDFIADNIRDMIIRGESFEAVQSQIRFYSSDEFRSRLPNFSLYNIYGFFDIFDEFYEGSGWIPPPDYYPRERPWYTSAVEAGNDIIISPVYLSADSNSPVLGYARCMFDNDGSLLGVISIDVPVSFINQFLERTITDNSYGFIVNERSIIIVHPSEVFVGEYLAGSSTISSQLVYEIRDRDEISRSNFTSYTGVRAILFSSETFNGWYVNFVVPEAEYYRDLYYMITVVTIMGALMATMLSISLVRIEAARNRSELRNRQKSNFLANMSHEIRTPMNSIIGFSELALDDNISSKTRQYLVNITDNAKWLLNIINDILDSSKIESGKIILEHIPYDMQDVISQCQSAILPKAAEKGISLYCYAERVEDKKLVGDPVRLRQVFMNLLSNAVKFTDAGSVKLLASVKDQKTDSATICIEVKDTGIGMYPEQIDNIFEPFMQADDSVTRKYGGTGLGLTIAKNIIELLGGKLRVESEPGAGSTFTFDLTFDLVDDDSDIQETNTVLTDTRKPNFDGEILVCEDNGLNQQVICEHLARVGLKVVVANDGREGVELVRQRVQEISGNISGKNNLNNTNGTNIADALKEYPFDLIFMDIHMPVMDGLEAAELISALGVKTPIVALTANIMSKDIEHYRESGILDYLGKPFTAQNLWRCLVKYLPVVSYSKVDELTQAVEDDKALKQLRIYFVRSNRDIADRILQAIDDGDAKLAHRLAHTLKGNAGQIGETQLQETAAVIEGILVDVDNSAAAKLQIMHLENELYKVFEKLTPLLIEEEEKKITEITDTDKVKEILGNLEPVLMKRNPECMNMLDDIRAIPGADELALLVEDFEFKKALEELERLKSLLT